MSRPVVLVFVLVLLSACGGEDPPQRPAPKATPDPVAQVRELAPKVVSGAGGYELCFEHSTDRFIRAVYKGDREACRNIQQVIGTGTPKVLDAKVKGDEASVSVEYAGSVVKGRYGTLEFVREGDVWKLDKVGSDFVRATAVVSVRALSTGALSVPEVQQCVARQTLKLSDAAVRKYVYALFRLDQDAGPAALRLVNKCPKQVAIYVAEELALGLKTQGYSRRYVECAQPRLEGYMALTGIAPNVLSGSDKVDFGKDAVTGLIRGVDEQCRRYK
jgi:hypothetical protein